MKVTATPDGSYSQWCAVGSLASVIRSWAASVEKSLIGGPCPPRPGPYNDLSGVLVEFNRLTEQQPTGVVGRLGEGQPGRTGGPVNE